MSTTAPAVREPRPLGIRRKPQLRLALGYRDEQKKGAPVKTDYFIPKGNDAAVAKFRKVYGDKPRSIDVRLPGSLGGFLEIKHLAFAGGQSEGGGILKAVGRTNFALEGTLGGPDVLTVFTVDDGKLSVDEIEISGADDPAAAALGVQLTTTVAFGIPDVLGFGGVCAITSRGKETTDTLWETAVDIYGNLGAAASMILRPKLILKESKMLTPQGQRTTVYVLDLYVPESRDEIMAAAREYRELLPGRARSARAELYGPAVGELPETVWDLNEEAVEDTPAAGEGATNGTPADGSGDGATASEPDQQAGDAAPPSAASPAPDFDDEPSMEEIDSAFKAPPEAQAAKDAADAAGQEVVANGNNKGLRISQVAAKPKGPGWIRWCIAAQDHPNSAAARTFAKVYLVEEYQAALAEIQTRPQT